MQASKVNSKEDISKGARPKIKLKPPKSSPVASNKVKIMPAKPNIVKNSGDKAITNKPVSILAYVEHTSPIYTKTNTNLIKPKPKPSNNANSVTPYSSPTQPRPQFNTKLTKLQNKIPSLTLEKFNKMLGNHPISNSLALKPLPPKLQIPKRRASINQPLLTPAEGTAKPPLTPTVVTTQPTTHTTSNTTSNSSTKPQKGRLPQNVLEKFNSMLATNPLPAQPLVATNTGQTIPPTLPTYKTKNQTKLKTGIKTGKTTPKMKTKGVSKKKILDEKKIKLGSNIQLWLASTSTNTGQVTGSGNGTGPDIGTI